MDPALLHQRLLAIGERIVHLRRQKEDLDQQKLAIDGQLREALDEHLQLVASATGADNATPVQRPRPTGGGQPSPLVFGGTSSRRGKVLEVLAQSGVPLTAEEVAKAIGDDQLRVYQTLQDLKRKTDRVAGPVDGRWTLNPEAAA